jgi:CNT family concentrative nucleoside transporter
LANWAIFKGLFMDFFTNLMRGMLGMSFLLLVCYLLSNNRRHIDWKLVGIGVLFQVLFAILVLRVPFVADFFEAIAGFFSAILTFSEAGARFLFGSLVEKTDTFGYIFAFRVLPTVVFFSAFSSMLYYFGILQLIIKGAAWLMVRTMGLSGPESLAVTANVFIGQTEAPLVVRPYLERMTRSELLCLMTGGMATIAGGVFAAYVGFLGGDDPVQQVYFAKHLLSASIMSAPAAIVASKMLFPEIEKEKLGTELTMSHSAGNNLLDAISTGTTDGLKLAVNVGAMLLVFTALVAFANYLLMEIPGNLFGLNEKIRIATDNRFEGLTFTYILGLIFAPVAWLLGTPSQDILLVGQLLGQKTVINEFVAYAEFGTLKNAGVQMDPKSVIIAVYALCGFSNFASIGIQIGGIGSLAPGQRQAVTELGIKALIGGTVACFMTATIAGIIAFH